MLKIPSKLPFSLYGFLQGICLYSSPNSPGDTDSLGKAKCYLKFSSTFSVQSVSQKHCKNCETGLTGQRKALLKEKLFVDKYLSKLSVLSLLFALSALYRNRNVAESV